MRRLVIVFLFIASGCSLSLDPPGYSRLSIEVGGPGGGGSPYSLGDRFFAVPTTSSGFDCLAVNVVGLGIAPAFSVGDDPVQRVSGLLGGAYCSYPGINAVVPNTPGVASKVSLKVPSGPRRIIQVAGVQQGTYPICSKSALDSGVSNNTGFYELGRAITDLFRDTSVSIDENWNTLAAADQSARKLNCGGGAQNYASTIQSATGLVSYWRLNETGGTTATNGGPSLGNLTYTAAVLNGTTGPLVKDPQPAVSLATSSMAAVGQVFNFSADVFTFEIWVKYSSCNYFASFFHMRNNAGGTQIKLDCNANGYPEFYAKDSFGNIATATGTASIGNGAWHHLVGRKYDASHIELYVDGALAASATGTFVTGGFSFSGTPYVTEIAYNTDGSAYQAGYYAEAAIYQVALAPQDIASHYQIATTP